MNILLIRPRPDKETIGLQHVMICEPLELEYIAANINPLFEDNKMQDLRSCDNLQRSISHNEIVDINIEIIDMIVEKREIEYFIKLHKPDIVGITSYITHVHTVKDYAKRIKKVKKDCIVAVGGVHAEVVPQDFVSKYIDYIIEADGIDTFNRIIKTRQIDSVILNEESVDIKGVYKEGFKNIKKTEFNYNPPAREKTSKYRHRYYYMFHNPCALVKTSFGCPYSCSFCFCKEVTDGKYFARQIDDVISELKSIPEREIYIVDDDFLFDAKRLNEFCDALEKNKINKRFLVYGRADFISENENLIKRLAKNGLSAVIVGLESFRNDDLDSYNKKTSIHQNERAVKILQMNDIEVYATLILHLDFEKKDFTALKKWIYKMNLTFVNLQPLTPLPGTDIYDDYAKDIIISRKDYAKWDLAHMALMPKHMSIGQYYFEIIKLYYQIVLKPKNVIRLIRKYGLKEVIKLSSGSSKITNQYIRKMIRNSP